MADPHRCEAVVTEAGGRVFVVLPFDPNGAWGLRQRHHVAGTVNGRQWRGPLEHDGRHFVLSLGSASRRNLEIQPGARVELVLWPEGPQVDNVGPDVAAALEAAPEARAFFEGLPTFYRKNYVRWIESAKRPATRAARIAEMIALLNDQKRGR